MLNFTTKNRILLILAVLIGFTTACKKDDDAPAPSTSEPGYRTTTIDYNTLTATTSYKATFTFNGDSTINRNSGRDRLRMFRAFAAYMGTATTATIDSATLSNMFANRNSPFTGIYADLNDADFSIKSATASSKSNQAEVHNYLEIAFGQLARISAQRAVTAVKGTAGKNGNYLVDEKGVEWGQIIQKTLIGAYHLDYIGNILLNYGLTADNKNLVPGKKYTALEHNWDEAYGFFTLNDMYYNGTTDQAAAKLSNEYYLASYVWEYNKPGFVKLHSAFLKGRAAIHNNDMVTVRAQAAIIRDIFEKAIAGAAEGYMYKASVAASTEDVRAHAFGEGLGFIYATRFCTLAGGDDTFANGLKSGLINTATPTFYDITAAQYTAARNAITTQFGIVVVH